MPVENRSVVQVKQHLKQWMLQQQIPGISATYWVTTGLLLGYYWALRVAGSSSWKPSESPGPSLPTVGPSTRNPEEAPYITYMAHAVGIAPKGPRATTKINRRWYHREAERPQRTKHQPEKATEKPQRKQDRTREGHREAPTKEHTEKPWDLYCKRSLQLLCLSTVVPGFRKPWRSQGWG